MKVKKTDLPVLPPETDILFLPALDDDEDTEDEDNDDDDEDMMADEGVDTDDDDYDSDEDADIDRSENGIGSSGSASSPDGGAAAAAASDDLNDNWENLSTPQSNSKIINSLIKEVCCLLFLIRFLFKSNSIIPVSGVINIDAQHYTTSN